MTPFFSVVIPLYNKEAYIIDTLNSVLNQTFGDFEIIIIDDGSTDNSLKVANTIKDNRISISKQKNSGVSVARNNGIKMAKSRYIALLDADDYWYKNHLFELRRLILTFPDAGLYCNNYEIFYSKDLVKPANINFQYEEECVIVKDYFKASITNSVAWTSAVAFSKEKFNSIGEFNTRLRTAQDLDLWIRMALKYMIVFNPKITMSYKLNVNNSLSKKEFNDIRYEFINSYSKEEKGNPSLKRYLDVNRYAIAIRCLMNNELALYSKTKKEINYKSLNNKQRLLLKFPRFLLLMIRRIQQFLINNGIYLTAYK
ncbi:glycosyltransferase [Tamlana sp. 2201CG12-4]|uniref:glycosyltransferase family 2 protein n=1 Tax=Tamlana sp. 2201CG12-4 TaxID=3112582 RepID=UPI002DBE7991|nr:glycosyltransferase [Tamlana sp. 2201CG12-4]MEC3907249.1 glycosyltransferase [Tamlana sp. 2201CG12-4]